MSESIMDGVKYVYAEGLKGKRHTVTIKKVTGGAEFFDPNGRMTVGWDIAFEETPKILGVTGVTVRRQLVAATGTDDPAAMVGKKIVLFPVPSKKSATGEAIRIGKVGS